MGLRIEIRRSNFSNELLIYLGEEEGGKLYLWQFGRPARVEVGPNKVIEPSISIDGLIAGEFLEKFAEALGQMGIKTDNDHKIQGLLEATKYHLEDMRGLVFKKKGERA